MRGKTKLEQPESAGVRSVTHALDLPEAPVLHTSTACKSGLAFLELAFSRENAGATGEVRDDAFLIALQLKACPDFDLYEAGRLIRPREFEAGAVAIFDLRTNLATDLRDSFHAVDLYIPRKSLDALAEDANAPAIDELRHEPGRALQDPTARHLLLSIRPALAAPGQASELFVDHLAMALATHVARQLLDDGDAVRTQLVLRSDARLHQHLRCVDGAHAQDHFAIGPVWQ